MSVLGLDSGYTVKNTPMPSGVPLGFALGNSFRQSGIFDRISLLSSKYGYSISLLSSQYRLSTALHHTDLDCTAIPCTEQHCNAMKMFQLKFWERRKVDWPLFEAFKAAATGCSWQRLIQWWLTYTALHYTDLHCSAFHSTALHCTNIPITTLHCTVLY